MTWKRIFHGFVLCSVMSLVSGCGDRQANEPREMVLQTEAGEVNATVSKSDDSMAYEIKALTAEERSQLETAQQQAVSMIARYLGPEASGPVDLKKLDKAFSLWVQDTSDAKESADQAALYFGTVFGQVMVDTLDMHWVMVTDQYGTSYGIQYKETTVLTFPIDSVAKRIDRGETGFFEGLYFTVKTVTKDPRLQSQ